MSAANTAAFSDNADTVSCAGSIHSIDLVSGTTSNTRSSFGFNEQSRKTNLTLVIDGECVYVSRAVLELTSPVFQELLDAHDDTDELELEGKDYDDFVEFLACFYPGKSHRVTEENVFTVLPLADEFDISHVKNQCETCLQTILESTETSTELFFRCIQAVYRHKLDGLKTKCMDSMGKRPLYDIQKTCNPGNLPGEAKTDLYESLVPKLISDVYKYRYLFAGMSKKRAAKFDEWQDLTYFTIDMNMKADVAGIQKSNMLEVWGMQWSINISRHLHQGVLGTFLVSLQCHPDQNACASFVSCEGTVTVVVKNNIPWNEHVVKETQFSFTPSRLSSPEVRVQESAVFNRDAGFLMDKQYGITAHVLLQKPLYKSEEKLNESVCVDRLSENQETI